MLKEHLTVVVEEAVDEGARLVNASDADIAAVAVGEHELALEQGREEIQPCVTAVLVFAYQLERAVGICLFVVADTEEVNAALFAVELEVYRGDRLVKTGAFSCSARSEKELLSPPDESMTSQKIIPAFGWFCEMSEAKVIDSSLS